ncbi:hypothetical protein [Foetidibacter luteolus]|uniref:hypothetical protein n=1 Tax=Foetidibacter luteolus TaxID=2608880 RepID=UPI00129BBC49|nr:hypothetical protein [Foetidibacter luteolus]
MRNIINGQNLSHSCIAALAFGAIFNTFVNDYSSRRPVVTGKFSKDQPVQPADSIFNHSSIGLSKRVVMYAP